MILHFLEVYTKIKAINSYLNKGIFTENEAV